MILYHGGTEAVMQPDCKKGRPDLDFGQGFYVTLLQDQAEGFARRKARDRKGKPVISVYEFDYDAAIKDCVPEICRRSRSGSFFLNFPRVTSRRCAGQRFCRPGARSTVFAECAVQFCSHLKMMPD